MAEERSRRAEGPAICDWEGCSAAPGPSHFIFGKAYCPAHYGLALEREFLQDYGRWDGVSSPSHRLLNLFSRHVEAVYRGKETPGSLSKGRLNDRSFNVKKVQGGLEFSIIRHPYAWTRKWTEEVEQRWKFNIEGKELEPLGEMPHHSASDRNRRDYDVE